MLFAKRSFRGSESLHTAVARGTLASLGRSRFTRMIYTIMLLMIVMVISAEVKFVHPVSPGGSVKFVASGVNFSIFTHFLCFFLLKLLKLGEIDGVKFLT